PETLPDSSDCTIDLDGLADQVNCLVCSSEVGMLTLDVTDFSNSGGICDPDGWQLVPAAGNLCSDNIGGCVPGGAARACCDNFSSICVSPAGNEYLQTNRAQNCGGGDKQWRLYKTFDTSGLSDLEVCFDLADWGASGDEWLLLYAADSLNNDQIFCQQDEPQDGINSIFYNYCVNLPAWAADNNSVTLTFIAHSNNDWDFLMLDNIVLRGWYQTCAPSYLTVFTETFDGCPDPINDGWNAWEVIGTPTCDGEWSCGSGNTAECEQENWTMTQVVDASGLDGNVTLCFTSGDDRADAGESITVSFDTGTGIWQTARYQAGNMGPNQTCRDYCVNLSAIDPAVNRNPNLGISFYLTSNNNDDEIELDNISVSGAVYCDGSAEVSLSAISDDGGGAYSFTATDVPATRLDADINCVWDWPPVPIEDWSLIEFLP
ncbi:MAG: hypothetical protein JRJ87_10375, partial [Deltaproteobacteria bacterium]|nr:hypothetical protein [Deltaproteobacteria bacterium]